MKTVGDIRYKCAKHGDIGSIYLALNHDQLDKPKMYCFICIDDMISQFCHEVEEIKE